jgi:Ser/Thr protein kinase RdoA (MazF antagonist)
MPARPPAPAVDPDLRALLERCGAPLANGHELTRLRSSVLERPAWRLELADGRALKGRIFADEGEAERFCALHRLLPERGFPQLVDRQGRAVLLEWVVGSPPPARPGARLLRDCGRLLGELHRATVPKAEAERLASPASRLPYPLDGELRTIAEAGWLEPGEAERLLAVSERARPEAPEAGLTHLDVCPDNLVVQPAGRPVLIDNATLSLAPLDHDLGRTWYRWPMDPPQREAFLSGYRERRATDAFQAAFPYWRICGLAFSAWLRVTRETGDVSTPVAGLRRVLHWAERQEPAATTDPARLAELP